MALIVERSRIRDHRYDRRSHRLLQLRSAVPRGVLHARLVGEAGFGTAHVDGNTRLCTATAAKALMSRSGPTERRAPTPTSTSTDAILLVGHNMAATQTVLWARGPRSSGWPQATEARCRRSSPDAGRRSGDVHLAPRPGTNLPLLNGILRSSHRAWLDRQRLHPRPYRRLRELESSTEPWTPERGRSASPTFPARHSTAAAEILGTSQTPRVHLPAGRLPVPPGHRQRAPGQQRPSHLAA